MSLQQIFKSIEVIIRISEKKIVLNKTEAFENWNTDYHKVIIINFDCLQKYTKKIMRSSKEMITLYILLLAKSSQNLIKIIWDLF